YRRLASFQLKEQFTFSWFLKVLFNPGVLHINVAEILSFSDISNAFEGPCQIQEFVGGRELWQNIELLEFVSGPQVVKRTIDCGDRANVATVKASLLQNVGQAIQQEHAQPNNRFKILVRECLRCGNQELAQRRPDTESG